MAKEKTAAAPKIEGQFEDSPTGWARYWQREMSAARDEGGEDWPGIKAWQERAGRVVKRYRANKKGTKRTNDARINLFPANVQTQRAILVGNTPKCEVTRRFDDADDDVARVASEILERLLNQGLEEESRGLAAVLRQCTEDRLLPGMCGARVQFSAEFVPVPGKPAMMGPCPACGGAGQMAAPPQVPPAAPLPAPGELAGAIPPPPDAFALPPEPQPCPQCQGAGQVEMAPAIEPTEKPTNEQADAAYVNWRDQLWSPCRTPDEKRWHAYAADMSRKQLKEMFEEGGDSRIPALGKGKKDGEAKKETPWTRYRVWEVWSKEHKRLFWVVEGFPQTLTNKDNPSGEDVLGLEEFFPSPVEMMANATTDAWLPTPDFEYAEDLYNEADDLTSRIRGIVKAIKVAGVYDKTAGPVRRLLDEACELELIPVADWSTFLGQKGGLAGAIQLLPVKEMVETLQVLVSQRNIVIEGIYQITGLGDIIRGQQQQSETATTSAIKARFASVRLQDLQKEVARYATDLQRLRKEVIAKHWSPETIIQRSCVLRGEEGQTPEGQERVLKAVQLIKDKHLDFCVSVKPEQVSLQDWAQLKQQRSEVLTGLGAFFSSMTPMLQMLAPGGPEALHAGVEFAIRSAQWLVAGMPGSGGVEAAFDSFAAKLEKIAEQAAQQAQQPKQPPPPDPKVQQQALKNQGEVQKQQAHVQGRMVEIAAETRAEMARRTHDAQMDVATANATSEARLRLDALRSVDQVTGGPAPGGGR